MVISEGTKPVCWRGIINSTILGDPWDGLWDPHLHRHSFPHPRIQLTDTSKTLAWGFPILLLTPPRRSSPHISPSSYLEPGLITISLWMDECCFGIPHSSIPKPTSTALFSSALGDPKTIPPRRSAHVHRSPTLHPLQGATPWYGCTTLQIHAGPPTHTEISHIVSRALITMSLSLFHSRPHSLRCINPSS